MPKTPDKSEEQKDAEAEVQGFKNELGPFVVAAEATRMAMVFADAKQPDNPIIFANDSFLSLTGYAREEVLGQSFNFIMAHAADTEALAKIEAEFLGSSGSGSEIRYRRKNGSEFWAALFISPVRVEGGDIVQYFASFVDLTALKDEQAHSRQLIDELNHRVKNTLATVQSIVWQALRTSTDTKVVREAIESRLFALSRSHDLLTRENWESSGLVDLITDTLKPFGAANGRAERIEITGENIRFPPKDVLALGIVFNELATNAVKFGALSNATGSIMVEWKTGPAPNGSRLILHWQEKAGPLVTRPSHKVGSRVIEHGLDALNATVSLDYQPAGLRCSMSIPAPEGNSQ